MTTPLSEGSDGSSPPPRVSRTESDGTGARFFELVRQAQREAKIDRERELKRIHEEERYNFNVNGKRLRVRERARCGTNAFGGNEGSKPHSTTLITSSGP